MSGRGFARDSLGFALSQYVSRAVLLGRGLVAAAALGPAGFGAWNALVLILDYGSYASLGALYGLDLLLPPAAARGDAATARREMRSAWALALAGGAAFALAVIAYLAAGTWLTLTGWGWGPPLVMLAAVFVQLAFHYHAASLRAHGDFAAVSSAITLQAVVGGGIGFLTVWRTGVWGLLWGWLIGGMVALIRMRRSAQRPPLAPGSLPSGLGLARAGFPLFAFFAVTMVMRSLDRIALVRFGGNEALGRYSLGLIAAGLVLYLPEAVAAVLFPRIAASAAVAGDQERTQGEVRRAQRALAALLPLAVGIGMIWAEPVVSLLLPAFAPGLPALRILAVGALLLSVSTLPGYYLLGSQRGGSMLLPALALVLVSGLLVFGVAARAPHATAVAAATVAGQCLFAVTILGLGARWLVPEAALRGRFVLASLAPVLWGGLLALALGSIGGGGVLAALVRSAIFVLGYAPALLMFGRGLGLARMLRGWVLPA